MSKRSVHIGDKFGKLTVMRFYRELRSNGNGFRYMTECLCECGGIYSSETGNLKSEKGARNCKECAEKRIPGKLTHGHSWGCSNATDVELKAYYTWQAMKRRCQKSYDPRYSYYGGRGIGVCDRWSDSYEAFLEDMGLPPNMECQIDRTDNDGNYEPGNCRWVSRSENARNKRNNRLITSRGKTQTLTEWASETGLKRETIARRLNSGSSPEEALSSNMRRPGRVRIVICPKGSFETISDCARALGMSISGVHHRINSDSYPEWRYGD